MFDQENLFLKTPKLKNNTINIINWWWHLG
ncbi:hypothetical protein X927_00280 [Petrotoga mexicana DSM 14811]|uniref:Uncharacterized protein n=1 Tax=Petrotoga mexicana DSM 14811 TaxID=1122954 RepID=A0A2K1PFL1_9BACT|nr:hypothetical protein X927_00280 [Petrotoga mexicana DSM 14811]